MDPIQAIAARQVSITRGSTAEEVDAFYDQNGLEKLYAARRTLRLFNRALADMARHMGIRQNDLDESAVPNGRVRKVIQ
jgi:hypothetical protein